MAFLLMVLFVFPYREVTGEPVAGGWLSTEAFLRGGAGTAMVNNAGNAGQQRVVVSRLGHVYLVVGAYCIDATPAP